MSKELSMTMSVRIKLSMMMFLQFMLFAVWFVPLSTYAKSMGVTGVMLSLIVSSMAIGCLVSPIVGMIADRHFASQKVLATMNALCAILLFFAARVTNPTMLFVLLLGAMLCYMPTWGLTSAIAMANSPSEKFPQIRVFGSIGWVASGLFSWVAIKFCGVETFDGSALPFYCGAGASAVAAVLAFTIPNTPPPAKGQPASVVDALGLKAFTLMKDFRFALFIIISMLVMIPFSIYWSYGGVFLQDKGFELLTATMNLGQAAEMGFMLLIPIALKKMGVKWAMTTGLFALIVRYAAFWIGGIQEIEALYFVAILVHGLIFGFFFVGGQIYIDKFAPKEIRGQAQGFLFLMIFGVGLLIGNFFNGELISRYSSEQVVDGITKTVYNWDPIWMINTVISVILFVAFAFLFKDQSTSEMSDEEMEVEAESALEV